MALSREEKIALLSSSEPQERSLTREEKIALLDKSSDLYQQKDYSDRAQAGIEAFGKGATFGYLPEIQAAATPAAQSILDAILGDPSSGVDEALAAKGVTIVPTPELSYQERVALNKQRHERQAEQYPATTTTGQIAGGIFAGGPASAAIGAAGGALGAGIGGVAPAIATTAGKVAGYAPTLTRAAQLGAEGAILGGLEKEGEASTGAMLGAGIPLAGGTIRAVGSAIPVVGKSALSILGGVKLKTINKYLKNMDRIKAAEKELSKGHITEIVEKSVQELKDAAQYEKINAVDLIIDGLEKTKQDVITGSREAKEILASSGKSFELNDIIKPFQKRISDLKGSIGPTAKRTKRLLTNFVNDLQLKPERLDGIEVKKILSDIDNEIKYINTAGMFAPTLDDELLIGIRKEVDKSLKSAVPEYKKKMIEVANTTGFLHEASKKLGDEQKTIRALTMLGKPQNVIKDKPLLELAKRQGIDLERFRQAQESADLFKNWSGQSVESKIGTLMNERSEVIKKMFTSLGKQSNKDFITLIEDLAVKTELEQELLGAGRFSLWHAIAGGGGGFILGGGVGAMAGAALVGAATKYGPQMTKKILDSVGSIRGIPTIPKILNLQLPENVKNDLVKSFRASIIIGSSRKEPTYIPDNYVADIRGQINSANHLTPRQKAEMLHSLNREQKITGFKELVNGGEPVMPTFTLEVEDKKKQTPPGIRDIADVAKYKREKAF